MVGARRHRRTLVRGYPSGMFTYANVGFAAALSVAAVQLDVCRLSSNAHFSWLTG